MSDQISQEAREDFDAIVQLVIPFAEQMLKKHGEFYPIAAKITTEGELVPFEPEVESEMPEPNQVLAKIASSFQDEAREGKIRAAGSCYDGSVSDGDKKLDAIILNLEHITAGALTGYVIYK